MSNDHEWLNLLEVSGPFLAVPVLRDVFPQGLEALPSGRPQRLRQTYEEWRDAVDIDDPDLPALHAAWIGDVLETALEMDAAILRKGAALPDRLTISLPEHGVTIAPDLAIVNPTNSDEPLLLIHTYAPDADLDITRRFDGLAITPADRMVALLRKTGCSMGLVTNGERWMLVHAPVGAVAGFASWYARLWGQEPETLRAFVSLLGVRRFFGPHEGKLPALYERSLKHQDDVTDALGEQVRRAVEVLVQALDRADQDRNRDLLRDVDPRDLYEAGLTIMMRLVFLLAAEERGLLLLGDPRYESFYAISSLRMQLRADSEEILERRRSAWSRLLALFRAVYGGIDHPTLPLPALGGSLFDPDRYPFLEGRRNGTTWRGDPAEPLPIDDRTVLLLLEAIQTFEGRTLSYRALDVEQIGHVYEGLLERTVKRVDDVTLELDSSAKAKSPRVTLGEMESARLDGNARVAELLKERSERSESAIRNALERPTDDRNSSRLLTICRGDVALRDRILPYAALLRTDPWGYPLVHHKGAFVVVLGADRRDSGTHYTPKSLTEKIVAETLTPVAYTGPAEGKARDEWELKSAEDLLELKVCDPAVGSGAFLVQACRWLSDRLVEAWTVSEANGTVIDSEGRIVGNGATGSFDPLSQDPEERAIVARRLVAERCLYGVDKNPLAVELAKLSLWLTTMSKGRPFGFLDHNLRSGDSLLGLHDIRQLIELNMSPKGADQLKLFGRSIKAAVHHAVDLRIRLSTVPIRDIVDVDMMAALNQQSKAELSDLYLVADALTGVYLEANEKSASNSAIQTLAAQADSLLQGDKSSVSRLAAIAQRGLTNGNQGSVRRPFHWPLEFPEVFSRASSGFDAVFGNPPWGTVSNESDDRYLKRQFPNSSFKLINYFKYFIERMDQITRASDGVYGFLVPSSLLENIGCRDTRHLLLTRTLKMVIDCGDGMFLGVTQACCFAVVGRRDSESDQIVEISTLAEKAHLQTEFITSGQPRVTIGTLRSQPNNVFVQSQTGSADLREGFVELAKLASVYDSGIDYSRAELGSDVFYTADASEDDRDKRVLRGRNVGRYTICFEGIWLRHNWSDIQAAHRGRDKKSRLKVNEKVYVTSPKILVRQTGDSIIAALDCDRYYHQKSLLCVVPNEDVCPYLLLALLNSEDATKIYQSLTAQSGRVFAQVKKNFLERVTLPWSLRSEERDDVSALAKTATECSDDVERAKLIVELELKVAKAFNPTLVVSTN